MTHEEASRGQLPTPVVGVFNGHINPVVDDTFIKNSRNNCIGAAERLETFDPGEFLGNHRNHLNIGVVFLETLANAGESPACPDPTDEMCQLAVGLFQDLHCRAMIMCLPVACITVLIGKEIAFRLALCQPMHLMQCFVVAFEGIGRNQVRPVRPNAFEPLEAGILRHHQRYGIAQDGAQHGVGNTSVTGTGVKNGLAGT